MVARFGPFTVLRILFFMAVTLAEERLVNSAEMRLEVETRRNSRELDMVTGLDLVRGGSGLMGCRGGGSPYTVVHL